jgi:hypothetical protein
MSINDTDMPDFDAIARAIVSYVLGKGPGDRSLNVTADHLCEVWNARGSADAKIIEASLSSQMGVTASGPYAKNLQRAIGQLDMPVAPKYGAKLENESFMPKGKVTPKA